MAYGRINNKILRDFYVSAFVNFENGLSRATPVWSQYASKILSPTESNVYLHTSIAGPMREWLGKRHVERASVSEYRLKNRIWEKSIGVLKQEIQDDQSGLRAVGFEMMGTSVALHPDDLLFEVWNNAHTSSAVTYDGVPFFSTAHPGDPGDPDAPTQSNMSASGGSAPWYLANLSMPLKPFIYQLREEPEFVARTDPQSENVWANREFEYGVEMRDAAGYGFWQLMYRSTQTLNADNLWAAWLAMTNLSGEEGHKLQNTPTHLIVPHTLMPAAKALLADKNSTGGYNSTAGLVQLAWSNRLALA